MAPIVGYWCIDDRILANNVFRCGEGIARKMLSIPLRWCHADIRLFACSTNAQVPMGN